MGKLFPKMNEHLRKGLIFCIFIYFPFGFGLFPNLMPLVAYGLWENHQVVFWVELVYHVINILVLMGALKEYLIDSFLTVQIDTRLVLSTAAIACGLMMGWTLIARVLCGAMTAASATAAGVYRYDLYLRDVFPVTEMGVAFTPGYFVQVKPLIGTLCMTLLAPIAVTGMFYATSFAPVCCSRPWLAYLVVAVVLLIPAAFDILWRGEAFDVLFSYCLALPVHWLACWSYQKSDCIWTPIFTLAVFNLLRSLINIFL